MRELLDVKLFSQPFTGFSPSALQVDGGQLIDQRELEIIRHIKLGMRSKEIAGKLSLSIHKVNRQPQNLFLKLNVNNALEACRIADATGILTHR